MKIERKKYIEISEPLPGDLFYEEMKILWDHNNNRPLIEKSLSFREKIKIICEHQKKVDYIRETLQKKSEYYYKTGIEL